MSYRNVHDASTPRADRDPLDFRPDRVGRPRADGVLRMAHVEQHPRLARNDVAHVRRELQGADRRDQAVRAPADALDCEHDLGRGGERVAPSSHRQRAGVPGLPSDDDAGARLARDGGDDTDRNVLALEHGPLLDVHLEIAGELRRRRPDRRLGVAARRDGSPRRA